MSSPEGYSHFFEVKLDQFDGPIDLLLHLVKQNELPIERLSLAQVASQYLACVEELSNFDSEIAAEYLVIAATLIAIKSSILLNDPVEFIEDEEGNLLDPQDELVRRLREAEIFRQAAAGLESQEILYQDVFPSGSSLDGLDPLPAGNRTQDVLLLGRAFQQILKATTAATGLTITIDHISLVERMMFVIEQLKNAGGRLSFSELTSSLTSRAQVISGFIALLELCKRLAIRVEQDQILSEISIVLTDLEMDGDFDRAANFD